MATVRMINVKGTQDNKPACGCQDWLDHWKSNTELPLSCCQIDGCYGTRLVAAHMRKAMPGADTKIYIVPVCQVCSSKEGVMIVRDDAYLVRADECDKSNSLW